MYHTKQIQVQIGGSDQFGNITAGIDAINYINKYHYDPKHRKDNAGLHDRPIGFTTPLLTTASGEKFGKSAGNAVWLDKEFTSTFDLYQVSSETIVMISPTNKLFKFFLRTADADVERYLKLFTFIPIADIQTLMSKHQVDASKRIAQHNLAHEVLCLIHGEKDAKDAAAQHAQMFKRRPLIQNANPSNTTENSTNPSKPADISNALNKNAPITTVYDAPSLNITLPASLVIDRPIARVLYSAGLVASGSEGHRLCAQEGAYVGSRPSNQGTMPDHLDFTPCKNWKPEDTAKHIIDGKFLILRVGKWRMKIVNIISDRDFDAKGMTAPGWPLEEMIDEQDETENAEDKKPLYDEHTGIRRRLPRREIETQTQIKKREEKALLDSELEGILKDIRSLWVEDEENPNNRAWREQAEREIAGTLRYGSNNERKKMAKRYGLETRTLKRTYKRKE